MFVGNAHGGTLMYCRALLHKEQFAHIATHFPGKNMSFMLIQASFPRVGEYGCYEDARMHSVTPCSRIASMSLSCREREQRWHWSQTLFTGVNTT
jgi:hypothetical protein